MGPILGPKPILWSKVSVISFIHTQVERLLTKDVFVILDSLNYIKGFRYELYCISKHMKTTHCIVQCDTPPDTARSWNIARKVEEQYTTEVFDGLLMRFEAPDSRNRWDSPLIVLYPNDSLPDDGIIDVLIHRKPPPPNQSTQTQPLSSVDFLHELDRQTQMIIIKILELQKQGLLTGKSAIPGTAERLTIHSDVTMAELRRLRHQFITYTKMHPFEGVEKISTLFVQYLNNSL